MESSIIPYDYTLDRARRCLTIIAANPVTLTDVLAQLERQAADGGWSGRLPNVRTQGHSRLRPEP